METSLHRCLKTHYAQPGAKYEAKLGSYRIDVLNPDELVEIQHGSLAAIRGKILHLLREHRVRVVKPLIARKTIVRLASRDGIEVSRRQSPKRESLFDLFAELVYFRTVFPHPQLTLDVALVEMEETRFPGHGRRRRWRRDDFVVNDQRLVRVLEMKSFGCVSDLVQLLPNDLPARWHTGHLASGANISRADAQRVAYCLRHMQGIREVGKQGNARLYSFSRVAKSSRRRA